ELGVIIVVGLEGRQNQTPAATPPFFAGRQEVVSASDRWRSRRNLTGFRGERRYQGEATTPGGPSSSGTIPRPMKIALLILAAILGGLSRPSLGLPPN
ncbi:MAG: hypothetical protein V4773_08540, partial [Verrucomicrobiota bacterium]